MIERDGIENRVNQQVLYILENALYLATNIIKYCLK